MSNEKSASVDVLFVEDAFDQAHLVKSFFNALPGFNVVHAQDGDQAMKLLASREWDLLVTDLNLPGTDGFSVIRSARERTPALPILVTTGYTQAQYEEQALRAGADQVMIKPLTQNDFVSRVWSMLGTAEDAETAEPVGDVVLVVEGRLGDAEMGCGGTMMKAAANDSTVVVMPLLGAEHEDLPAELRASAIAADIMGVTLRIEKSHFGNARAQGELLTRALSELRPGTVYLPAADDRDPERKEAHYLGIVATTGVDAVYAYETATTGLDFTPSHFVDIHAQMVFKMEALAAYQSVGAPRVDLRPRMAQAYARYWGRFRDFTEVEAFELLNSGDESGDQGQR